MAREDYRDLGEALMAREHEVGWQPDTYYVDLTCGHELKPILTWRHSKLAHFNGSDERECGGHDCLRDGFVRLFNGIHFRDAVEWNLWMQEMKGKSLADRRLLAAVRYEVEQIRT